MEITPKPPYPQYFSTTLDMSDNLELIFFGFGNLKNKKNA